MKTRTRNAFVVAAGLAAITAGLVWVAEHRGSLDLRHRSLDAVPNGALLVATADLDALRASPVGAPFLRESREIQGLGRVREVCGFDPIDGVSEIALSIPAAGDAGDFGVVAAGEVQDEALIACASKVIEARGGRPVVTIIGSFRTVRDASLAAIGGEIAVRKGGPVLLGAGAYLRAMIDAADGRSPTIRSSAAHARLAREVGQGALRVTVVLTPEQRRMLEAELANPRGAEAGAEPGGEGSGAGGGSAPGLTQPPSSGQAPGAAPRSPGGSVVAGVIGVELGATVSVHGVLLCEGEAACRDLAGSLRTAKDARAGELATRMMGLGDALERMSIEASGEQVHARTELSADEATKLVERLLPTRPAGVRR